MAMTLSAEQRRALELLAMSPRGFTESIMMAHGFAIEMLAGLARDGLASAEPERIRAGQRPIDVARVRITDSRDEHQ